MTSAEPEQKQEPEPEPEPEREPSRGFHWERRTCTDWNRFICEIPTNHSLSSSSSTVLEDYISERECQENVHRSHGFVVTVKSCFHLVRLQYTREKAEQFCREKWNESLANLEAYQREGFLSVLKNNSGESNQVQM